MLIKRLFETRKADASLATDIRAALIESLFAPIASLIFGAVGCSIIGGAVALRVGDRWIMAVSVALFAVGMLRVASAVLYRRNKGAARRHQAVGARLRTRRLGILGLAWPAVLADDYADH